MSLSKPSGEGSKALLVAVVYVVYGLIKLSITMEIGQSDRVVVLVTWG